MLPVSMCGAGRFVVSLTLVLVLGLALLPSAAVAQRCSADSQCAESGRPRSYCAGNTLVVKQAVCSGTCRSVEVSRTPCPGPCSGDRCIGGSLLTPQPGPPLGGSLVGGACTRVCACRGKQLTYGVGVARTADQCRKRTVDCVYGCSCSPEPRCLKRNEASDRPGGPTSRNRE